MNDETTYNVHNGQTILWCAYYTDRSGVVIFAQEIGALRHAVEHHMEVKRIETGVDVWEQVLAS